MGQQWGETWVDRQIREAQERGEFDDLPGAGKPLTGLGDPLATPDADWWVRGYARREGLDLSAAMPAPLALRREAAGFPDSLLDLTREEDAREVLEDFNRRVRLDRLRPAVGAMSPILAPTVDVDEVLERWRARRAQVEAHEHAVRRAAREEAVRLAAQEQERRREARWWRRLTRGWRHRMGS